MFKRTVETDERDACIGLRDTRDPERTAAAPQECVLQDFCECDGRRPINLRLNRGRKGKDTKDWKGKDEQKTNKIDDPLGDVEITKEERIRILP